MNILNVPSYRSTFCHNSSNSYSGFYNGPKCNSQSSMSKCRKMIPHFVHVHDDKPKILHCRNCISYF